jgi:hypothetical protein
MVIHLAVADLGHLFCWIPGNQRQPVYSPWRKFCRKGREANSREVCFTLKNEIAGELIVAVVLVEPGVSAA